MGRVRTFFVGRLHDELAELRDEVRMLRLTVERRDEHRHESVEAAIDQRTRDVIAQALVTLALDRERPDQASDGLPFST